MNFQTEVTGNKMKDKKDFSDWARYNLTPQKTPLFRMVFTILWIVDFIRRTP